MPLKTLVSWSSGPMGTPVIPSVGGGGGGGGGGGSSTNIDGASRVGAAPQVLYSAINSKHTSAKWTTFNGDGTKVYIPENGTGNDEIWTYDLSTPYDITTYSNGSGYTNSNIIISSDGMIFNPDGTKMILFEVSNNPSIKQYDLNTPYDVSSVASNTPSATISNDPSYINWDRGVFANNGSKFYAMQTATNGIIKEFTCSTPGDLATASAVGSSNELQMDTVQGNGESRGLAMNAAGTRLYVGFDASGDANEQIFQYELATQFDLSTASYNSNVLSGLRSDNFAEIRHMTLINDTDLYMQGLTNPSGGQGAWQYSLPAQYSSSNATDNGFFVRNLATLNTLAGSPDRDESNPSAIHGASDGSIYITGVEERKDIGFIQKHDATGALVWAKQLNGTANFAKLQNVKTDSTGAVYAGGYDWGYADNLGISSYVGLLAKFDKANGNIDWVKIIKPHTIVGGSAQDYGDVVDQTIDDNDNIWTIHSTAYGTASAPAGYQKYNINVVKLNTSGIVQGSWVIRSNPEFTGNNANFQFAAAITHDASGNIYIMATTSQTGGQHGQPHTLVIKFNSTMQIQWQKIFGAGTGTYHGTRGKNIALDSSNDVYIAGYDTPYSGSTAQPNVPFLVKLSGATGIVQWGRFATSTNNSGDQIDGYGLNIDDRDVIHITGRNPETNREGVVLQKFDIHGNIQDAWYISRTGNTRRFNYSRFGLDEDKNGNLLMVLTDLPRTGNDSYKPAIIKLPKIINAGTEGDLKIDDLTHTSSVWSVNSYTHSTYSIIALAGNNIWVSVAYSSGADQVLPLVTPTVTADVDAVTGVDSTPPTTNGFIQQTTNWNTKNGTNLSILGNAVTQASDGSYYFTGEVHSKSGWLAKFNEAGAFQWVREYGTYYLRSETAITDSSNNVYIAGSDYGYGENLQEGGATYDPQVLYVAKFNSSGTRQWSKLLRYNTLTNNNYATMTDEMKIDSHGNIWMTGYTHKNTSHVTSHTVTLYKIDSAGALSGVWRLPSSIVSDNSPTSLVIDENDNMYISWTQDDPGYSAQGPHGVVAKMSIPGAVGSPTFVWVKEYGMNVGGTHYDVPYGILKSSDGNVIVYGYTDNGGTFSSSDYETTFMKLNDTNGDFIWKKRYDSSFGDIMNASIDDNDKIYFTSSSHNAGYTHYYFWVRQIDATDGSHENLWEVDFTGTASNGQVWQFESQNGNQGMIKNKDGNIVLELSPNGNASGSYEQVIWKFPSTMITGTHGKLEITSDSTTPTDATYNAVDQTYASYSTVTSIGGQYQTADYVSGTHNDTVTTPTLSESLTVIAPASSQGWISTISDELQGYGYTDLSIRSLAVDGSDNIIAAGDSNANYQAVVKIKPDGTVDSAASFGASGNSLKNRAVAVDSYANIFTAGEGPSIWNSSDGHVMRLTSSLSKSYDDFFGEGSNDEHFDIATAGTNAFVVGEANSFALNWSSDPKGYLIKYDSSGGVAKQLIGISTMRSYPRGVSSDGTNAYVIGKDHNQPMWIAKVNSALNSVTWSANWGTSSAQTRLMDIDTNSSGESAALMFDGDSLHVVKIDSNGFANMAAGGNANSANYWKRKWSKAQTGHGDENTGYDWAGGVAVKLLSNGGVAVLVQGFMPYTGASYKKSFYIVISDSTGNVTVQKEFKVPASGYYLGDTQKALVQLSDGKLVTAFTYYTGSAWKNGIFKFDPTDTSNAINGTYGDWTISDITDGTSANDTTQYSHYSEVSGSVNLDSSMSMYFKSGYTGASNGYGVSNATVIEGTQNTL